MALGGSMNMRKAGLHKPWPFALGRTQVAGLWARLTAAGPWVSKMPCFGS